MIRGRSQDKEFRWEEVRVRGGQTHFLVFNEPENSNQGDLTVDEAIALYPKAQQLGLRLGSPARTDNAAGNNWLQSFMTKADAKGYRVDYVSVHNYAARNATQLKNFLDGEFAKYNRPIWLTEFQRDVDNDNPDGADHLAYLEEVVPMLEELDYLERYAYYTFGTANPPNAHAWLFNGDLTPNARGLAYLGDGSNPSYRNTGQGTWATATLNLANGQNIIVAGSGERVAATLSLDPSIIASVEFFIDGQPIATDTTSPHDFDASALPHGLHTITARAVTRTGDVIVSPARQAFVAATTLTPATIGGTGEFEWSTVPGETYRLESSGNLEDWVLVEQGTATGFSLTATDPAFGDDPERFYRVVWE